MYGEGTKKATIQFVTAYGDGIIAAITDTGIFFPAIVAQTAWESGWGQSELTKKYNNFGGIKNFGNTPGASGSIMLDTTEVKNGVTVKVKQPFAIFPSVAEGFKQHIKILQQPLYIDAGVFTASSPEDQILRIANAGYTTTPADTYLSKMQPIIDATLDLYHYGKIYSMASNNAAPATTPPSFMDDILNIVKAPFR